MTHKYFKRFFMRSAGIVEVAFECLASSTWGRFAQNASPLDSGHPRFYLGGMSNLAAHSSVTIRRLRTSAEYEECVRLQREVWGDGFPDLVPPSILLVSQKIGGLVAGAFDEHGALVGFTFALNGFKQGERILWSDMLAVRAGWRGCGIGTRLKKFQREEALKEGIRRIYWTFDPLVARNARLNLVHLGAAIESYVPDMYLEGDGDLHRGLGMDRFITVWDLTSPAAVAFADGSIATPAGWPPGMQPVNTILDHRGNIVPIVGALHSAENVLVEIPADIHAVRDDSIDSARLWRESTRRAFLHYLQLGFCVEGLASGPAGRVAYLLST